MRMVIGSHPVQCKHKSKLAPIIQKWQKWQKWQKSSKSPLLKQKLVDHKIRRWVSGRLSRRHFALDAIFRIEARPATHQVWREHLNLGQVLGTLDPGELWSCVCNIT
jgi:hypothetical protein